MRSIVSDVAMLGLVVVCVVNPVGLLAQKPAATAGRIETSPVRILGTSDGPGMIVGNLSLAVRDGRGRYYIHDTNIASTILVYGQDGEYLTTVGRKGAGPGEYRFIAKVVATPGDTLHVFDQILRRRTVLSPSYDVIRTQLINGPRNLIQTVVLGDGGVVYASHWPTAESIGLPLHHIDAEGKWRRSFGADLATFRANASHEQRRVIARANGDDVWSAHWYRYVIERWDVEGRGNTVVERNVPWFPPYRQREPGDPPEVRVMAVHQDTSARLWALLWVPDRAWRQAPMSQRGTSHETWLDYTKTYDTVVEVFSATGELLASKTIDPAFTSFLDDGLIGATVLDEGDVPFLHVWRIDLQMNPVDDF